MGQIIISTTFREFEGNKNDDMQLRFLRSLEKQTFQNFVLVVTVFSEKKVEKTVRTILQDRCFFIYDEMNGNYQFSLSKTFINGVDYGLKHEADILLDCSSDVVLQKDFLETISNNCPKGCAGISHPNIFVYRKESGEHKFKIGSISKGIDARFFSLELFRNQKVYQILQTYPSYDYGAGIEAFLCGIAIKYAKERTNIFMESKVIKEENDRDIEGRKTSFMRLGYARNYPIVERFAKREGLDSKFLQLKYINRQYTVRKGKLMYAFILLVNSLKEKIQKRNRI